jgi:hypothetical protein
MRIATLTRVFLIAIITQLHVLQVLAQNATSHVQDVISQNQMYSLRVAGLFYEGFVGGQQIVLMDAKGDTLWTQVLPRRFLILPSVSNNGDVAIVRREITIFDKQMRSKGSLPFAHGESPYSEEEHYQSSLHGFSLKGDKYLIVMRSPSDFCQVDLICITDSAKFLWSKGLGNFRPQELLFTEDKLILHDCGTSGADYTNFCYVFDLEGKILWQHQTHSKTDSDWSVTLDSEHHILIVTDNAAEIHLRLDKLTLDRK